MKYTHEMVADYLANSKSPVQLVKHWDEVPDAKKQYPIIGQQKHDGVYAMFVIIDGIIVMYGRTGMQLYYQGLLAVMPQVCFADGVYITEYCNPRLTLEQLSGLLNPNRKKEYTADEVSNMAYSCLYFHDYITVGELLSGWSARPYIARHDLLERLTGYSSAVVPYSLLNNEQEVQEYAESYTALDLEGAVFKKVDAGWLAGHKGFHAMKIVKGVHLDLKCVGVVYGKGKREGQIAALELEYKGNVFKADLGKGWTDERRNELTMQYKESLAGAVDLSTGEPKSLSPIGAIWEVKALDISSTGKALRLPKVVRVRWDKDTPDD